MVIIIDGDTSNSTNIRMIGIDTPETNYRGENYNLMLLEKGFAVNYAIYPQ